MYFFNIPTHLLVFIFGLVLFKVQVSEQFSVDVGRTGSDESAVEKQTISSSSSICEGSLGINYKCVRILLKCYCFVNKQMTWDKAQDFCSLNGMSLISVQTQFEQNCVSLILMPIVLSDPVASTIGIWSSGNYNAGTKTFSWAAQTPFTFVNWFHGEPMTASGDQCLRVRIVPEPSASWATLSCDQWMPFICQSNMELPVGLPEITVLVRDLKKEYDELKNILIASTSPTSISRIPNSCKDLMDIGHRKSGLYSVMGTKQIQTVYCDFTKDYNALDFQKLIGYEDVKSMPTYFYVQRNASFNKKNTPIPFDTAKVNTGEAMNLSTGKFTAPRAGTYYFSFAGLGQYPISTTNFNSLQVQLFLNGNLIGTGQNNEGNTIRFGNVLSPVTLQSTLRLQKGDQLWVQIGELSTDGLLFDSNSHSTHFTGYLVEEDIALSL